METEGPECVFNTTFKRSDNQIQKGEIKNMKKCFPSSAGRPSRVLICCATLLEKEKNKVGNCTNPAGPATITTPTKICLTDTTLSRKNGYYSGFNRRQY